MAGKSWWPAMAENMVSIHMVFTVRNQRAITHFSLEVRMGLHITTNQTRITPHINARNLSPRSLYILSSWQSIQIQLVVNTDRHRRLIRSLSYKKCLLIVMLSFRKENRGCKGLEVVVALFQARDKEVLVEINQHQSNITEIYSQMS